MHSLFIVVWLYDRSFIWRYVTKRGKYSVYFFRWTTNLFRFLFKTDFCFIQFLCFHRKTFRSKKLFVTAAHWRRVRHWKRFSVTMSSDDERRCISTQLQKHRSALSQCFTKQPKSTELHDVRIVYTPTCHTRKRAVKYIGQSVSFVSKQLFRYSLTNYSVETNGMLRKITESLVFVSFTGVFRFWILE